MKNILIGGAVAALFAYSGGATAATIDFTDRSVWSSPSSTANVIGATVSVSADGGDVTFAEDFDGASKPAAPLAFESDGAGVSDSFPTSRDEVTGPPANETLYVDFSKPLFVTGVSFLDLFKADSLQDQERAFVDFLLDGVSQGVLSFTAQDEFAMTGSGFASFSDFGRIKATRLAFTAGAGNDNVSLPDYAVAALEVQPIPLPAPVALLGGALLSLGWLNRRRRTA